MIEDLRCGFLMPCFGGNAAKVKTPRETNKRVSKGMNSKHSFVYTLVLVSRRVRVIKLQQ